MLKFFRSLRQDLLAGSKFSKYLLYAIGEIVLVVIGILIALYINNRNEDRIRAKEEYQSLTFLKAEFEGNLHKFDVIFNRQLGRKEAINRILFRDLSETPLAGLDTLYQSSFYSWTYNPSFSTYNSLVSSNKLNQLSNDSLKIRLSAFRDLVADYQEDEENLWDHSEKYLFDSEIFQSGALSETKFGLRPRTQTEELTDRSHYLEFFNRPEYRNKLSIALLHLELIIGEGTHLRKELLELNQQIDQSISKL